MSYSKMFLFLMWHPSSHWMENLLGFDHSSIHTSKSMLPWLCHREYSAKLSWSMIFFVFTHNMYSFQSCSFFIDSKAIRTCSYISKLKINLICIIGVWLSKIYLLNYSWKKQDQRLVIVLLYLLVLSIYWLVMHF